MTTAETAEEATSPRKVSTERGSSREGEFLLLYSDHIAQTARSRWRARSTLEPKWYGAFFFLRSRIFAKFGAKVDVRILEQQPILGFWSTHFPFMSDGSNFFSDTSAVVPVHSYFLPAPPLVRPKYADFFLVLQAGNFERTVPDTFHSIRHRGFRVLSTSH